MEDPTDIVPEQYTLTFSLDNDKRNFSYEIRSLFLVHLYIILKATEIDSV